MTNQSCRIVLVAIFILAGCTVYAQSPELFKVQYNYLPETSATGTLDTNAVSFSELAVSLLYPLKSNEKWAVLLGAGYSMVFPNSSINELDTRLYFIALQCTTVYRINQKSQWVGMLLPAISSTLQDPLSIDDFLTQASVAYFRDINDHFSYGIGGIYTSRFGFPQFLPLISIKYKSLKSKYEMIFPTLLQATWNYQEKFSYSIKASINGSQYNPAQNAVFNNIPVDAVNFSRILLGPEIAIRLKGNLYLSLFGGLAARRLFEFNSETGIHQDLGIQNGAFISTKFSIKPPRKN